MGFTNELDSDVSVASAETGEELILQLVQLMGLPEEAAQKEIESILNSAGVDHDSVTLDDLRGALLTYLEKLDASAI